MIEAKVRTVYKKKDGTRVPGVTTCLGILGKPAIIHWAWECGVQGIDYRKVRDQAGDIGTLVHYLILCRLRGVEPALFLYTSEEIKSTESSMDKFNNWYSEHTLEPLLLETPLVSECFNFGGTSDFYGKVDGRLTLLDFKTSKEIYPENFYQLAAYEQLLTEYGYPVEEARILRVGKSEEEGFEDRMAGNLLPHWQIFLACQQIYELQKTIGKIEKESK